MRILSIDFGTSRIKAAVWDKEEQKAVPLHLGWNGKLFVPDIFHVNKKGRVCFGDEAAVLSHQDPLGKLDDIKTRLNHEIQSFPNGQQIKTVDLLSLVFKNILSYSKNPFCVNCFNGLAPEKIVLAVPPAHRDIENIYRKAMNQCEFRGELEFMTDAEASARIWVRRSSLYPGSVILVIDAGGGTIDWSCVQVDSNNHPFLSREYAPQSIPQAGRQLDKNLFTFMINAASPDEKQFILNHCSFIEQIIAKIKDSEYSSDLITHDSEERPYSVHFRDTEFCFENQILNGSIVKQMMDSVVKKTRAALEKMMALTRHNKQLFVLLTGGMVYFPALQNPIRDMVLKTCKKNDIEAVFCDIQTPELLTVTGAALGPDKKLVPGILKDIKVDGSLGLGDIAGWMDSCCRSDIGNSTHIRLVTGQDATGLYQTACWFTHSPDEEIAVTRAQGVVFLSHELDESILALLKDNECSISIDMLKSLKALYF